MESSGARRSASLGADDKGELLNPEADQGLTRARRSKRRRFSIFLSDVRFEDDVLRIEGRRSLTSLVLLGFALTVGYALFTVEDLSVPIQAVMALGVLLPLYGFLDVFFGQSSLEWYVRTGDMRLARRSPLANASFEGTVTPGMVRVRRIRGGTVGHSRVEVFQVVLTVELDDASVDFPLDLASKPREAADAQVAHWEQALGLAGGGDTVARLGTRQLHAPERPPSTAG